MSVMVAKEKAFLEMDRRDQQQIVLSYLGEVVDELFYEVEGRKGLSWQGINTVCYYMGDIKVERWVQWDRIEMHGQEYWSATVRAVNERYNLASLGTAEGPLMKKVYDRDEKKQRIPDGRGGFKAHLEPSEHCRRIALSKAQRNAKRAVIPEPLLIKWLEYFIAYLEFIKGKIEEKPEPPIKPKITEAEYEVILKPSEKREPPRRPKPTPKREPTKKGQIKLGRKLDLGVIEYNLKALGFGEVDYGCWEEGGEIVVEPARELDDEEHYKIDETLRDMGAVWEDAGHRGMWRIPKGVEE